MNKTEIDRITFLLRQLVDINTQILAKMPKEATLLDRILGISATIVTIFGALGVLDLILRWLGVIQ